MRLTEHVHALKIPFQLKGPGGPAIDRFVYVYLVYGRKICLVDTGVASSPEKIFQYIRETGREPRDISIIVQTHTHVDHTGATSFIKEATGATVLVHSAEQAWLSDPDLQFKERPVPGFYGLAGGPVRADGVLDDGDTVDLGDGLDLVVFHTPGHSSGSLSFFLGEDGVLFCGDAVPVPGDLPIYDDVRASVDTLARLGNLPGIRWLLSSWADPRQGARAYQAVDEGLRYVQKVHEAVLSAAGNTSAGELMGPVLAIMGLPVQAANPLVERTLAAHLKVLDRRDLLGE